MMTQRNLKSFTELENHMADYMQETMLGYDEQEVFSKAIRKALDSVEGELGDAVFEVAYNETAMLEMRNCIERLTDSLASRMTYGKISVEDSFEIKALPNEMMKIAYKYAKNINFESKSSYSIDYLLGSLNEIVQTTNDARNDFTIHEDIADLIEMQANHASDTLCNFKKEIIINELVKFDVNDLANVLKGVQNDVLLEALNQLDIKQNVKKHR